MSLEFTLNSASVAGVTTDCVIVGAFADGSLSPAAQAIDEASGGRIAALITRGDASGKTGRTALLHDLPGVTAPRVLVIGLGDRDKFGAAQYLKAVGDAARALRTGPVASALFTLTEVPVKERDAAWNIRQAVVAAAHACYRYTATLGAKNKKREETGLKSMAIAGDDAHALAQGKAIAAGVRSRANSATCRRTSATPAYLAQQAQEFAARFDAGRMRSARPRRRWKSSAWARCSRSRAARRIRRKLIVLNWNNGGDAKPYVLVGKGITFDTGGINLKPAGGMEEMKYDMCGAATVMGAFVAAVGMQLPINLVVHRAGGGKHARRRRYRPTRRPDHRCRARPSKSATPTPKAA